jgi:hypothetical protein
MLNVHIEIGQCVATLALGWPPRQGFTKVQAKNETQKSHFMFLGMWESVKEWTSTLQSELPLWELESRWTPKGFLESLESDCRGQNPLEWKVSYIIRKLLERKCLKWIHVTHFGHLKHKLWPKKGPKSNCQFHFWLLNVGNRFDSLACRWRATYCWEALNKGYNFALNITLIKGLHTKLWASKVMGVPILGISRLPLGSPETKWHLGASYVARHTEYYKGEDGGFPQVRAMVSLVSLCLHVAHPCTKGVPTTH